MPRSLVLWILESESYSDRPDIFHTAFPYFLEKQTNRENLFDALLKNGKGFYNLKIK
jgi:hypothetical protein